ncbi:MAG: ATP-binding protein [Thaumarchaeota archaeon]|nr:ATP-binding protein [Nitrososphaerota archaeon]
MSEHVPRVWDEEACIPREEVLSGSLTDADLALRLSTIVSGTAKPPYDNPVSFLSATHLTSNMRLILESVAGRLSGTKKGVNPVIVLDVGFGGGKTHTLATLYYAAKYSGRSEVSEFLGNLRFPRNVKVVTISGEDYKSDGITRDGTRIRTIWGDLFWQLGKYDDYAGIDREAKVPGIDDIKKVLEGGPVLILLDELPSYLKLVALEKDMLDKTIMWIQRLVLAVSEKDDAVLVMAIAEDVYRSEAEKARQAVSDAVRNAMAETRAHVARKELVLVPIEEEDAVHILKRRLFKKINSKVAEDVADAYHELYQSLTVPDEFKSKSYRDMIRDYYPFHPHLIRVLYERVATLDRFQRTRGALRLLVKVVRKMWSEKEEDATLIHPFHVDLADRDVLAELSTHIGEQKLRNAVEADVWKGDGTAVAEKLDEQAKENWGVPLVRRACNTIYLYSLTAGKEGDKGIRSELLVSLLVTPARREHFMRVRDIVLDYLSENFHFVDRQGERFVFVREPTPIRVIDLLSRDITESETLEVIKEKLRNELFKRTPSSPDWIDVELFPSSPSKVFDDEPVIQVAILNPNEYVISDRTVPERVRRFLEHRDDHGQHARMFTNSTFLLVAAQDRIEPMKQVARKVVAARMVKGDLKKYGISEDRKNDVEEYLARQEKNLHDYIRGAFSNFVYYDAEGVKVIPVRDGSGYASGASGYDMLKHILVNVLGRVKDEPLDPVYVFSNVWPAGAESVSIRMLFEQFYRKPGMIISSSKDKFLETVRRGVENGVWVLKCGDMIYTKDNPPKSILMDERTELLTPEEADKLLRGKEKVSKDTGEKRGIEPTEEKVRPTLIVLAESSVETLANDIEKRAIRDRFTKVNSVILKISSNDAGQLLEIKNLLTRLGPERNCNIRLSGSITRPRSPSYTISFEINKEDLQKEEGKSMLDLLWRLKGIDSLQVRLELKWGEPVKPEDAAGVLRSLGKDIVAGLEANVGA